MPMGEYKDFDDCVNKNKDKDNPQAYCGSIKQKVEGAEMETKEDNTNMKQASPNAINRVSKVEEKSMGNEIKQNVKPKSGFDISKVPKRMIIGGVTNKKPILEGASDETSIKEDKPRYRNISIDETEDGFVVSSYNPEVKNVCKDLDECYTAIEKILNTPTEER